MRRQSTRTATIILFSLRFSHKILQFICTRLQSFWPPDHFVGTFFIFFPPHSVLFRCPFHICAKCLLAPFFFFLFFTSFAACWTTCLFSFMPGYSTGLHVNASQRVSVLTYTRTLGCDRAIVDDMWCDKIYIYGPETIRCYEKERKEEKATTTTSHIMMVTCVC